MKRMVVSDLHLSKKLWQMWNTLKRAGKEGNTAERKTAERKAGDKRKITNEEKLDILVSTMLEYLENR